MGMIKTVNDAYYAYCNRPEGVDGNTKGYCKRFKKCFGKTKLEDLREVLNKTDSWASNKFRSPAAIQRDMVSIRAMLRYAEKLGADFRMPRFAVPSVKSERVRCLSEEEEKRLYDAGIFHLSIHDLAYFMLYTGARPGEACSLLVHQVDLNLALVKLSTKKGRKTRWRAVPLGKGVFGMLWQLTRGMDHLQPVFTNDGMPWTFNEGDTYRTGYNINEPWKALMKDAQIEDFNPYDCRHTFATRLREKGVALDVVSKLLGHTMITTTQRYAHLNTETHLRDAVNKL
jgi:integrase